MRILIYEALPDINRAPFIARLAGALQRQGHEVLLALEERLIYTLKGALTEQGVIDCRGVICAFIASNRALRYTVLPTAAHWYSGVTPSNLEAKLKELSSMRAAHFADLFDRFRPDLAMIWNGQAEHQQDFMAWLRAAGGCQTLFLEWGWFPQREFFYWDRDGVNARCSIARRPSPPLDDAQREQIRAWKSAYTEAYRTVVERRKQILVPLQVDTDTNVTLHSPFASMAEFLQHLAAAVRPDYDVIVRPHPMASYPYDIDCGRANFRVDRHSPLYELIAASEYVIGINSTVLLEALAFEKKVFAFGRGIFCGSNAVGRASLDEALPPKRLSDTAEAEALLFELVFRVQIPFSCQFIPLLQQDHVADLGALESEKISQWLADLPAQHSRLTACWSRGMYQLLAWMKRIKVRGAVNGVRGT